jgi:hypothetical protein
MTVTLRGSTTPAFIPSCFRRLLPVSGSLPENPLYYWTFVQLNAVRIWRLVINSNPAKAGCLHADNRAVATDSFVMIRPGQF